MWKLEPGAVENGLGDGERKGQMVPGVAIMRCGKWGLGLWKTKALRYGKRGLGLWKTGPGVVENRLGDVDSQDLYGGF